MRDLSTHWSRSRSIHSHSKHQSFVLNVVKNLTLVFIFLYFILPFTAEGEEIFLGVTNATNSENCGGLSTPCETLIYIIDNIAKENDVIVVLPGTYELTYTPITIYNLTITGSDENGAIFTTNNEKTAFFNVTTNPFTVSSLTFEGLGPVAWFVFMLPEGTEDPLSGELKLSNLTFQSVTIASNSPSPSTSLSPSPSISKSPTKSRSLSVTPSITPTISKSASKTPSKSRSNSISRSASRSLTPSNSLSSSLTVSQSLTPSLTMSSSLSSSSSLTPSLTSSILPSSSSSSSVSSSISLSSSLSPSTSTSLSQSMSASASPITPPSSSTSTSTSLSPSLSPSFSISSSFSPSASFSTSPTTSIAVPELNLVDDYPIVHPIPIKIGDHQTQNSIYDDEEKEEEEGGGEEGWEFKARDGSEIKGVIVWANYNTQLMHVSSSAILSLNNITIYDCAFQSIVIAENILVQSFKLLINSSAIDSAFDLSYVTDDLLDNKITIVNSTISNSAINSFLDVTVFYPYSASPSSLSSLSSSSLSSSSSSTSQPLLLSSSSSSSYKKMGKERTEADPLIVFESIAIVGFEGTQSIIGSLLRTDKASTIARIAEVKLEQCLLVTSSLVEVNSTEDFEVNNVAVTYSECSEKVCVLFQLLSSGITLHFNDIYITNSQGISLLEYYYQGVSVVEVKISLNNTFLNSLTTSQTLIRFLIPSDFALDFQISSLNVFNTTTGGIMYFTAYSNCNLIDLEGIYVSQSFSISYPFFYFFGCDRLSLATAKFENCSSNTYPAFMELSQVADFNDVSFAEFRYLTSVILVNNNVSLNDVSYSNSSMIPFVVCSYSDDTATVSIDSSSQICGPITIYNSFCHFDYQDMYYVSYDDILDPEFTDNCINSYAADDDDEPKNWGAIFVVSSVIVLAICVFCCLIAIVIFFIVKRLRRKRAAATFRYSLIN